MNKPLTPKNCDLRDFQFMPMDVRRLLTSETWVTGSADEKCAAMSLWLESWHQVPAASLPDNEKMLAHLSGAGSKWKKVKPHVLRSWTEGGDGRLYHPVVAEKALEAWIEKLSLAIAGNTGNAKRWQIAIDSSALQSSLREAVEQLKIIAPRSKSLNKKPAKVIQSQSPPDSPPDSGGNRNRQGQGQGQGLNNTSSSAREDFFQESVDNQPKFNMFFGWQVSPHFLTDRKAYGFNSGLLNEQVLTEFCGYWLGKNEKLTQVEWEHKLANNLVKLTNNPVLSTCTARKSNVPDNNTTDWLTPELAEEIGL